MNRFVWPASPYPASFHLEDAMERSRMGLVEMAFSLAICLVVLASMVIGVVAPPAQRQAPVVTRQAPAEDCEAGEITCTYPAALKPGPQPMRPAAAAKGQAAR